MTVIAIEGQAGSGVVDVARVVARELDLFAAGEANAESLGVNTTRTKLLVLVTASLAASAAVAVAGQIAFVGLVVPHLVRLAGFRSYRTLLPLSLVGGAIFLLGADVAQRYLMERELFKPGVLMSMVGGPFFLFLLVPFLLFFHFSLHSNIRVFIYTKQAFFKINCNSL